MIVTLQNYEAYKTIPQRLRHKNWHQDEEMTSYLQWCVSLVRLKRKDLKSSWYVAEKSCAVLGTSSRSVYSILYVREISEKDLPHTLPYLKKKEKKKAKIYLK